MRSAWTDERLTDLAERMDAGFARVDADIRVLRTDMVARMDASETRSDARFNAIDARFNAIDTRFDALHRLLFRTVAAGLVTVVATVVGARLL